MLKGKQFAWKAATYVILVLFVILSVLPLLWVLSTSIKHPQDIFAIPPRWIPERATLGNYKTVIFESTMPRYLVNSTLVALSTAAISTVLGCFAGYGFARYNFPGNRSLSLFMLLSQMLPLTVLIVPLYNLMTKFHLDDSIFGLSIAHLALTMPLVTWMARSYFLAIPPALEEAAQVDGCSRTGALVRIVLPLSAPGIAAIAVFAFLMSWNEFVLASILTMSERAQTLPIGLTEFAVMFRVDWGSTMAAATLMAIPVVTFFLFLQKYFIQGMTQGAVKD